MSTALALGTFDGVHLGHQRVIAAARAAVGEAGEVVAVTFWPHPMAVFSPASAPPLLQDLDAREDALLDAGADKIWLLGFTPEMAALQPGEFVAQVLAPARPAVVVVGPDFTFGVQGLGTPQTLALLADGFDVITAPLAIVDGQPVSSTLIRALVGAGDVAAAARALGRDFSVRGVVVRGDQRGRLLGYPTANVPCVEGFVTPADGVYAGWLRRLDEDDAALPAAISVGDNPTFGASRRVEAHVLDFNADLYDVPVEIGFRQRLRGMTRFNGVPALVAQMRVDVEQTRKVMRLG